MEINTEPADEAEIIDPSSGEVVAPVLSFANVFGMYKSFVDDNRDRNRKNAAISKKINGEQPWRESKLRSAGQSWRSNRPTGFMNALLKRLTPPYKQMVDQMPLLTYAKFSVSSPEKDRKRDVYRKGITDCLRNWSGWSDFVQQLVDEDIVFGYAAVGREDDYSWKPVVHRGDEAFFYVGCPQLAEKCKAWALKKDYFVDDIVEVLSDLEIAKSAGWRVNNLIKKLNFSSRQFDRRGEDEARLSEDLARENSVAASFTSSVKVVKTGHVFVVNPKGGVDHYIFDRDEGTPLFFRRAKYAKMQECLSLFSAEVGDQTLHGSRGAGRALYNTHVSVEQARNLIQDALHLSAMVLVKRTSKAGAGSSEVPALSVAHPFAILSENYEVLEKVKFEVNADAFFALDRHATSQAEVQIGAFMPGQMVDQTGDKRTASEVNYTASLDAQIRAGVLMRFADQFFSLVDQLQQRVCSLEVVQFVQEVYQQLGEESSLVPIFDITLWLELEAAGDTQDFVFFEPPPMVDLDAIQAVYGIVKEGKLAISDFVELSRSSSRSGVEDIVAAQSGVLDYMVGRYATDPVIDVVELKRRDISSRLGAAAAERLLKADLNPLSDIKQQRTQLYELSAMLAGAEMPTDSTDNDVLHLQVISSRIQPMLQNPSINPLASSKAFLTILVGHADQHIKAATEKGVDPKAIKEATSTLEILKKYVQLPAMDQQAAGVVNTATQSGAAPISTAIESSGDPNIVTPNPNDLVARIASPPRPSPTGEAPPIV